MSVERQQMDVDIACVGFGPAMGGFLTTLNQGLLDENGMPRYSSQVMEGMPPQIICYERADDLGFGVSGIVTSARSIRTTFPDLDPADIPMATPVAAEEVLYLLDPHGASRRPWWLKVADRLIRTTSPVLPWYSKQALRLPYTPPFLHKNGGLLLSMGQFTQWVGSQVMGTGMVQVWPGMPVKEALLEENKVVGIRLVDQGTDKSGNPDSSYMPGMDIKARLTVVGDGPVGPIGQQLNRRFGFPTGHHQRDWAIGMKAVVELPENTTLKPGTVLHTFGYPEPEIFGFMYVYPDRVASLGVFIPSTFDHPARTAYRYLQHWMMHPYLWQYLDGATLRSWGAKTLQESGKTGEPVLVGDGYARIGEGSGSTNMLTGSGVDEAWETGVQLGQAVLDLLNRQEPFTTENLDAAYVARRRNSWLERELQQADRARHGFQRNFLLGMLGMGLTGLTKGRINIPGKPLRPAERIPSLTEYYRGRLSAEELDEIKHLCAANNQPLHDELMNRTGWPQIPFDGKLLVSHQDALLMGGKVQAPGGYADHVVFVDPQLCRDCQTKVCIEGCSGQAIMPGADGDVPQFDREKCVHCGACLWNCAKTLKEAPERSNIDFRAGTGGLHSAEN